MDQSPPSAQAQTVKPRRIARLVFTTFLLTFIASRALVILIMLKKVPDLFLHLGGTHVHHLNYGISLLATVGAVLLFTENLTAKQRQCCGLIYGFAMALTFDEFGMWLHLGGSYWQRASFDAVIVVLSLLGAVAFAPKLERMRSHHWATAVLLLLAVVSFYWLLFKSLHYAGVRVGEKLRNIEMLGPQ